MAKFDLKTTGLFGNFQTEIKISQNINGGIELFGEIDTAFPFIFDKKPACVSVDNTTLKLSKAICRVPSVSTKIDFTTNRSHSKVFLPVSSLKIHYKAAKRNVGKVEFFLTNLSFFYFPNADNSINVNGINLKFELLGHDLAIKKYLKGNHNSIITTKIIIDNLKNVSMKHLLEVVKDVSWLCSFASGNLVSIARIDIYDKDHNIKTVQLFEAENKHITNFPIVNISNEPGLFKRYIGHSLPPYQRYKNTLLLPNLINLLFLAKQSNFIEQQMLLLANFLEVLRFNYASNIAVPSGKYTKSGLDFFQQNRKMVFEKILKDFFRFNKSTGWLTKYKDMRNEIIHTGKIETSSENKIKSVSKLQEFCERIILGILDWDKMNGRYLSSSCPVIPTPNAIGPNYINFKR